MIAPRFAIFSLFILLAGTTGANAGDKDKLRRAASLPHLSIIIGYGVNRQGDFITTPETAPHPEKIAELEKELKGDATDVECYRRLAKLYYRTYQPAKGKEVSRKVVSLLREQLEQHPDDRASRLRLADALERVEKQDEAETLVRRVVKDHPNDWHAWLALGEILDTKCWEAITNGKPFRPVGPEPLLQAMRVAQPTPERIAASQRYRREAVACFDRAVALAPREPKTYRQRGGSRYTYGFLDLGLRLYKGEKADFSDCFLGRESISDLRKAVELDRQEYMGLGMVAMVAVMVEVHDQRVRDPSAKQLEKLADYLSESTLKCVREDMAWLEKGVRNPDQAKAAEAAEVLGFLQFMCFQDWSAAEKSARRSIALDPTREAAWDILSSCLLDAKKYRKAATVCRQRLERTDSARNRLLLAKAYESLDQLDKAEEIVRAGLKREPDDFMLRLTLADLLLIRGGDEDLNQAGQILYQMREEKLSVGGCENRWANYAFACGVYFGLLGEGDRARDCLEQVQKHQPNYKGTTEALKALGE